MPISIIAAMDRSRGIGKDNKLPWHIPADMRWFKSNTTDKIVVMGRKTFESLGCKPLPNRFNIVLSKSMEPGLNYIVMDDVDKIIHNSFINVVEVMVIGGAEIYNKLLPYADKLYLTEIDGEFDCDTFFPDVSSDEFDLYDALHCKEKDINFSFNIYHRKESAL